MSPKEIDDYITKCPYFYGKNTMDRTILDGECIHIGACRLEFHYRPICPSSVCLCAEKLGLEEKS